MPPPLPDAPSPVTAARGGALAGTVAAAPALAATGVNGLLTLCLSCLGTAPAAAAGAGTSVGVSAGGVAGGLVVVLAVVAVQLVRLRRCCPAGPVRRRAAARQVLTLLLVAGLSFAAVQWLLMLLLTPGTPSGSAPTLP